MKEYHVCLMPGDGIGPEVTAEAKKTIDRAAALFGFAVAWQSYPYGAEHYLKHKVTLPETAFAEFAQFDAMLLGAVGDPRVKPGPLEQEILLALRFHFDQYVNLRPALSFPGAPLPVPLAEGERIDAVIVRENTEDLYMGLGGRGRGGFTVPLSARREAYRLSGEVGIRFDRAEEAGLSVGLMTRSSVERITRYAFGLAVSRNLDKVYVVSKANAVPHLYGFWDEVSRQAAEKDFPAVEYVSVNVDAMCYRMARQPAGWGVVLCPNLFGDIISDLMSGFAGGLGLAAAGNIGDSLSMFEPVHGSAPDIANTGKANPLAAILSGSMLLRHLGETGAAGAVDKAVAAYLASDRSRPIELGGSAGTAAAGDHVRGLLR